MHIQEAKNQIRNAVIAYGTKDAHGRLRIPTEKQRPIFLVGAPGIGKTAIVEQIASELNIGFVSYAMTHHTRQSALGLPFIEKKEYGGETYSVSEYTMSEIIASVYEEMQKTGNDMGILFLDEINCVSETLAPSMLQFLQYKTFGRHKVPEGWIVVTAGNPPEYNDSVREFDIAMLDRLKKIEVEPDFEVWKGFAVKNHVHPVVLSYLEIRNQYFYRVTTTVDGMSFVTARGWDDLSQMIFLYEENHLVVNYDLISQYIQDEEIAKDFAAYYDLYHKYESDYRINEILDGSAAAEIVERAANAKFDERLSLISLLLSSLEDEAQAVNQTENALRNVLKEIREADQLNEEFLQAKKDLWHRKSELTDAREHVDLAFACEDLYDQMLRMQKSGADEAGLKQHLRENVMKLKDETAGLLRHLDNVFVFFEKAFGSGQEMLILVSELTVRPAISSFIYSHGCDKYYEYNSQLLFADRDSAINERIDALDLLELTDDITE